MSSCQIQAKRKRTSIDDRDKEMFWNIFKDADGGRICKIISEGTSTPQTKHDAWAKITKLFNESTGKDLSHDQVRGMYARMKDKIKRTHDSDIVNREFRRACAQTGGGKGPIAPPESDGDDYHHGLEFDDLEPTQTAYNQLVRPEHRIIPAPSAPYDVTQVSSNPATASRPSVPPGAPLVTARVPGTQPPTSGIRLSGILPIGQMRPASEETSSHGGPGSLRLGGNHPSPSSSTTATPPAPSSSGLGSTTMGGQSSQFSWPNSGNSQVFAFNRDGLEIDVEDSVGGTPAPRPAKRTKKKTLNEEATSYYSSMLKIRRELAEQKMKVLKKQERVENLKELILRNNLLKEGGKIPDWMEENESDSSDQRNAVYD